MITVTKHSAIIVATAAPNAPKNIMNGILSEIFTNAPVSTAAVNFLSCHEGMRYCVPIVLLRPITKGKKASTDNIFSAST